MNTELDALKVNLDNFFLIVNGSLIILMQARLYSFSAGISICILQAGFGFLEAGSVLSKNVTNILIKNFADLCFGNISITMIIFTHLSLGAGYFICCGYAFAFGEGTPYIRLTHFGMLNLPAEEFAFFFFQVIISWCIDSGKHFPI